MKKLHYIDTYSYLHLHEIYNSSSLLMFSNVYEEVVYYASKSSKRNVYSFFEKKPRNIRYVSIPVLMFKDGLQAIVKQVIATLFNILFIIILPRKDDIIINYNTIFSLIPINFFSRILNRQVFLVCHGEMEALKDIKKNSRGAKILRNFFLFENIKISNKLYFFVLGENIERNLKKIVRKSIKSHIFSFEHTAIYNFKPIKKNNDPIIKIGLIGSLRNEKGGSSLFDVINKTKINQNIEFNLIGKVQLDIELLDKYQIKYPKHAVNRVLSRAEMNLLIAEQNYILYLYPTDYYNFTASGSLFDSINAETPIIALKNNYFEHFFSRISKTGYLFDNLDELTHFIIALDNSIGSKTKEFNFKEIKEITSPINQVPKISKKMKVIKKMN